MVPVKELFAAESPFPFEFIARTHIDAFITATHFKNAVQMTLAPIFGAIATAGIRTARSAGT